MKTLGALLVCLLSACASTSSPNFPESKMIGEFCHSSFDAALCLDLKSDHTYSETFSGDGIRVLGPNGEVPKVTPEPRGNGGWRLEGNRLLLLPSKGRRRILIVEHVGDSIRLRETLGKHSREYRR